MPSAWPPGSSTQMSLPTVPRGGSLTVENVTSLHRINRYLPTYLSLCPTDDFLQVDTQGTVTGPKAKMPACPLKARLYPSVIVGGWTCLVTPTPGIPSSFPPPPELPPFQSEAPTHEAQRRPQAGTQGSQARLSTPVCLSSSTTSSPPSCFAAALEAPCFLNTTCTGSALCQGGPSFPVSLGEAPVPSRGQISPSVETLFMPPPCLRLNLVLR